MKDLLFVRTHRQKPRFSLLNVNIRHPEGFWVIFYHLISSSYSTYIKLRMALIKGQKKDQHYAWLPNSYDIGICLLNWGM